MLAIGVWHFDERYILSTQIYGKKKKGRKSVLRSARQKLEALSRKVYGDEGLGEPQTLAIVDDGKLLYSDPEEEE